MCCCGIRANNKFNQNKSNPKDNKTRDKGLEFMKKKMFSNFLDFDLTLGRNPIHYAWFECRRMAGLLLLFSGCRYINAFVGLLFYF